MKTLFPLSLLLLLATAGSACAKDEPDTPDGLPDAVFEANVSGAENHTFSFTLPMGTAGEYVTNGSLSSFVGLFSMLTQELPGPGWQINLVADMGTLAEGTYDLKPGVAAFANPSATNVYLAVSGNLTISAAELYQDVGPAEDWYIDGSFSGTFQDNETPPNTVTINGTFSGINIKVN